MEDHQYTPTNHVLEKVSFKILVIGESQEIKQALHVFKQKNKEVETDTLSVEAGIVDLSKDDIAEYDLILLKHTNTSAQQQLKELAEQAGVLVSLVGQPPVQHAAIKNKRDEKYWKTFAARCLFALAFIIIGHAITSLYPLNDFSLAIRTFTNDLDLDAAFGWMVLAGFVAQMVDGALGMGYGVISTTVLLSTGLNPAAISGSIHTAEMFSSGASGFSHYRFGNINKKLFKTLLLPGVAGAVIGAVLLAYLGETYGEYVRPVLSVYTLMLGARILFNAFKKRNESRKVKNAGWLAGAGGFLDSFGGGGWGPLVTSTLIAKGKTPRYIIGTVSLTEFFVTFGSALTFFIILGTSHIQTIAGLIIGGVLAAPIAARLAGKLKTKTMLIGVGVLVIISSVRTLYKTIGQL
ncbi:sulfite exporter TauE/SafE family protein [Pedobacter sp.]|uniref:sulfite exporter TauE/SafE family protein n=1 Tax=Pedobacter sp. TaxID=1411316 RepID=UPI003D7FD554